MAGNVDGRTLWDCLLSTGLRIDSAKYVLSGTLTLTKDSPPYVIVDANGADRKVLLPLAGDDTRGLIFIITNTTAATYEVNVRDSTDATLFDDLEILETGIFICDGTTWRVVTSAVGAAS